MKQEFMKYYLNLTGTDSSGLDYEAGFSLTESTSESTQGFVSYNACFFLLG